MKCDVCGRNEGAEIDRSGGYDGIPLGPIEKCETCGRHACPDCLHESDCCFDDAEDHVAEPDWSPAGWARSMKPSISGATEFIRV
jgi:hypothetical protein